MEIKAKPGRRKKWKKDTRNGSSICASDPIIEIKL